MKLIDEANVLELMKMKFLDATVTFHPDTDNTFAAYQIILPDKYELWINARNGDIIHAGRLINRI